MPLTSAAVARARPTDRAYKRWDEGGLYLLVVPTGRRSWMLRLRAGGRERLLTLGQWPELSLDAARARRDAERAANGDGQDLAASGPVPEVRTFEAAARAWHAHELPAWSPVHARDVMRSLERDVFPAIGATPLAAVTRPAVLALLERIEARGAVETARRTRQRVQMTIAFAMAKGWMTGDDPSQVGVALAHGPAEGCQAALEELDDIRALLAAVDQLPAAPAVMGAHRLLALTGVRLAAVRGMTWGEVEDLDGPAPLWRVPAARMKLKRIHKADARYDHLVPLAPAAVAVLRAAGSRSGSQSATDLVFRGRDGGAVGEGTIGDLYDRAGYAGRHVPHGWRASFSTVMNEHRPADRTAIDRALGHRPKDMKKSEAAYNRARYLPLRRELLEQWAALIL